MSDEEQLSQITLTIEAPEADAEELEELTRQLRGEILEGPAEQVNVVSGQPAPDGAKGTSMTMSGELAVSLKPSGLPDFLGLLRDWLTRHEDRRVEMTLNLGGNVINFKSAASDLPAVMQTITANFATTTRSGGADLNADEINVHGDLVGRDKVISVHAEAGAIVYLGSADSTAIKVDGGATQSTDDSASHQAIEW